MSRPSAAPSPSRRAGLLRLATVVAALLLMALHVGPLLSAGLARSPRSRAIPALRNLAPIEEAPSGGEPAPDGWGTAGEESPGEPAAGVEPSPQPTVPAVSAFKPWTAGAWGPEAVGPEPEPVFFWALTGGRDGDLFLSQNDVHLRAQSYGGSWKTPVVVVPAAYNEFVSDTPGWLLELLTSPKRSLYLYQRIEGPERPHYAHNVGFESGIYLRFVVDHYDDLPEVLVGVHGVPDAHNPYWREWVACLRPNMTYTSLNTEWVEDRTVDGDGPSLAFSPHQLFTEQCMRDTLDLIGMPLAPRARIPFKTFCCAQFAVHRDVIRRRPKAVWQQLYDTFGAPPGICHKGAPRPLEELVSNSPHVLPHQRPWGPEVDDGDQHQKIVLGLTMEHLTGSVWGGEPWAMSGPYGQDHFCAQFFHVSQCPGSPCGSDTAVLQDPGEAARARVEERGRKR